MTEDIKNKKLTEEEYKQVLEHLRKAGTYLPEASKGENTLPTEAMSFGALEKARDFLRNKEATSNLLGKARETAGFDPVEMQQSAELAALKQASQPMQPSMGQMAPPAPPAPMQPVPKPVIKRAPAQEPASPSGTLLEQADQKPQYDSTAALLSSLQGANNNQFGANLFDASNALSRGLNPLANHEGAQQVAASLHAGSQNPLHNYQQVQAQQKGDMTINKGRMELGNEQELNKSDSPISKLARSTMKQMGFDVPENISAGTLKQSGVNLGSLLNIKEATEAKKEIAKLYGSEKADKAKGAQEERDIKHIGESQTAFNKDKSYVKAKQGLEAAEDAEALLNTDNPITSEAVKTSLARLSGEVGVLTDKDVARFGGSKALRSKLSQSLEQMNTGKLTEENRNFMREIIDTFKTKREDQIKHTALHYAEQGSKKLGKPVNEIYDAILPGEKLPSSKKEERTPASEKRIKVKSKDGKVGTVPESQLQRALDEGYSKVEP